MNRKALSLAVLVAGAYPATSYALSLGDIESNSNLNQPLRAKIELLSASSAEAKQLQVRLAPNSVFNRVGVDRPAFLDSLRFTSTVQNGRPIILVTSDAPISEPFVNFLVEVSWPQGQLLKEYTVMLNPPVLMQPGTAFAGNEAAVRAEPRPVAGAVNRAAPNTAASQQVMAAQRQQQQAQQRARQQQQQAQAQQQRARQQQAQQQQRARQQQAQQQRAQQQRARQQQQQTQAQQQRARQQQAQQQQLARQQQQQAQQQRAQNVARTYRVRSGDTLFKVASRLQQPGVNVDQMMMALYRANPKAFIKGNINGLKAGAVLRAPAAQAARSTSRAQARRQVRQQYADWKKFRATLAQKTVAQKSAGAATTTPRTGNTQPANNTAKTAEADKARLEVLGKNDAGSADSGNSAAGSERLSQLEQQLALARESMVSRQRENKELKSRVNDLESMLRKKNRLIALRDDQLAQLQKQLADNGIQTAEMAGITPPAATQNASAPNTAGNDSRIQGSDIQNQVASNTQPAQNQIVRAQPADNAQAAVDNATNNLNSSAPQVDSTSKPAPVFTDQQDAEGNDLMSMLMSPLAWKIGAGALFSLLLLWLLSRLLGRRKAKSEKASMAAGEPVIFDADSDSAGAMREDQPFRELEAELDKAERGTDAGDDPFGMNELNERADDGAATQDIVEARNEQDEDETLMEANVYIAYGLHQQAESELQKALEKNPGRLDYRHKLLENYFASNDREAFDRNAETFLNTSGASRNSKMWQEISEWGQKISPDNSLYTKQKGPGLGAAVTAAGAAVAGAAASAIALGSDNDKQPEARPEPSPDFNALDDEPNVGSGFSASGAEGGQDEAKEFLADMQEDDDLGLDDFDFNLDELESELGDPDEDVLGTAAVSSPGLKQANTDTEPEASALDQELAETLDNELDFSLDDLAKELEQDVEAESPDFALDKLGDDVAASADTSSDELDFNETLDFDELLSEPDTTAVEASVDTDTDTDTDADADADADADDEGGIGIMGGLAAGAVAAAGATAAAVVSSKDKAKDMLSDTGNAVDSALDFDMDDELPALNAEEPVVPAQSADVAKMLDFENDFDDLPDLSDVSTEAETRAIGGDEAKVDKDDDLSEVTAFDFDLSDVADNSDVDDTQDTVGAKGDVADNVTNLNLHLDKETGLKKILPEDTSYAGAGAGVSSEAEEDSWLGDIDDALSFLDMPDEEIDLHEAHISTKLDLARAYLDMGDIEGARSTLEEVMVEGNDSQRQEAETLLHETG